MGAWQKLRAWVARLATEHGSPRRLFFACIVGAIVGTTPLFGLHIFICVALAKLMRLNQVVVYGAANISIPPLAPFLGAASIAVGGRVLHGQSIAVSIESLRGASPWHIARSLFVDWMTGAPFVGGAIGVALGSIVGGIAIVRRARADPFRPTIRTVDRRFARATIGLRQYAYWKIRLDPVYRAIARALLSRPRLPDSSPSAGEHPREVVDLGTGLGILPIVLVLCADVVHARGVDHDAKKIDAAKRVADGLAIDFEIDDVRTWKIPACDAITIVDVLHYFDVETQRAIVRRAFEALRPNGTIVIREGERGSHGSAWTRALEWIAVASGWNRGARPTWRSIDDLRAELETLGASVETLPVAGTLHPGNVLVRGTKLR